MADFKLGDQYMAFVTVFSLLSMCFEIFCNRKLRGEKVSGLFQVIAGMDRADMLALPADHLLWTGHLSLSREPSHTGARKCHLSEN